MSTRGQRNNNPLNIRKGNNWRGERPLQTDPAFEEFSSILYGLRAGLIILRRYIRQYQCNTVALIITRWAPTSENNTAAYIQYVSTRANIDRSAPIRWTDEHTVCKIVQAMALYESRQYIELDTIRRAYAMC